MLRDSRRFATNQRSMLSRRRREARMEALREGRSERRRMAISDERLLLQDNLATLAGQVADFQSALDEAQNLLPTRGRFNPRNLQEIARLLKLIKDGIVEQGGLLDTAKETFEMAHEVAGPRVRPNSRLRTRLED